MAVRLTNTRAFFVNAAGLPLAGAKLFTYENGTTTPLATYSDNALSTPNTNPVVADSSGLFGEIFLADDVYTLVLKDSSDNTIWTANDVSGEGVSVVQVSDLATGTAGRLITWDAGGNPTTVATGSSGQVLTSNGAGAPPTFQAGPSAASTTVAGLVELATTAETTTGTDTTRAITPAALAGFAKSISSPGYYTLPGGLIIQWGVTGSIAIDTADTISFPIAFPTACLWAGATVRQSTAGFDCGACIISFTSTQLTLARLAYTVTHEAGPVYWIAIGN